MKAELNQLLTQVGPGTPGGALQRQFWQPIALSEEFDPQVQPTMKTSQGPRLVKAVRALGQDFVLVKNHDGSWALMDRGCPHRGADLSFGRYEIDSCSRALHMGSKAKNLQKSTQVTVLRCPFHGWAFQTSGDAPGQCVDTPAEPEGSTLCTRIKARSYPVAERSGVVFAWLGDEDSVPPALPALDCLEAPGSHTFAFKGLWRANWLQCFEVGIDPAHPSFLHRFLNDAALEEIADNAGGKQFRSAAVGAVEGERWPMTRVMRELHRPELMHEPIPGGYRITALRKLSEATTHVRVTNAIFPHTFVIPLSETLTITQWHLPVDDTSSYWFSIFTSFGEPVDKAAMRAQRLPYTTLPDYAPKNGAHNGWNFSAEEQMTRTFLGMGEDDINVHDQWAVESGGALQDRTREHLGTSDKIIMAYRRWLQKAIESVRETGALPAGDGQQLASGPDTTDGFAPSATWKDWYQQTVQAKRDRAPWKAPQKA
jgi:phthalate 4,5-dioxygenase